MYPYQAGERAGGLRHVGPRGAALVVAVVAGARAVGYHEADDDTCARINFHSTCTEIMEGAPSTVSRTFGMPMRNRVSKDTVTTTASPRQIGGTSQDS